MYVLPTPCMSRTLATTKQTENTQLSIELFPKDSFLNMRTLNNIDSSAHLRSCGRDQMDLVQCSQVKEANNLEHRQPRARPITSNATNNLERDQAQRGDWFAYIERRYRFQPMWTRLIFQCHWKIWQIIDWRLPSGKSQIRHWFQWLLIISYHTYN